MGSSKRGPQVFHHAGGTPRAGAVSAGVVAELDHGSSIPMALGRLAWSLAPRRRAGLSA